MSRQQEKNIQDLISSVLTTPGDTTPALRRAVETKAARPGENPSDEKIEKLPVELVRYTEKVALHAYKVTDKDIEALQGIGYSDDAIFELTLSAALGAGLSRLNSGLCALRGEN